MKAYLSVWWEAVQQPLRAARLVLDDRPGFTRFLAVSVIVLYAFYGLSMGIFRGGMPSLFSGIKVPFLYLLSLAVCFPALYLINAFLGPRLRPRQCLRLLLLALSVNAAALASYAPFSFFFTLTTSRDGYQFLVMMHVIVYGVSGLISMIVVVRVFRATAQLRKLPFTAGLLLLWGTLYAFVGTQMAWALRPWIGNWGIEYTPLRPVSGSFIEAVWDLAINIIRKLA
jgi:hypothetical protein